MNTKQEIAIKIRIVTKDHKKRSPPEPVPIDVAKVLLCDIMSFCTLPSLCAKFCSLSQLINNRQISGGYTVASVHASVKKVHDYSVSVHLTNCVSDLIIGVQSKTPSFGFSSELKIAPLYAPNHNY